MTEIGLSRSGPPETILPDLFPEASAALDAALAISDEDDRRDAISGIVAAYPRFIDGWARLGELGRHPIERYAAFRVGYHRGLDTLRQNGWRGSGFVRWTHPTNRGFLRALAGLQHTASEIGETDEDERCDLFLRQLDPVVATDRPVLSPIIGAILTGGASRRFGRQQGFRRRPPGVTCDA